MFTGLQSWISCYLKEVVVVEIAKIETHVTCLFWFDSFKRPLCTNKLHTKWMIKHTKATAGIWMTIPLEMLTAGKRNLVVVTCTTILKPIPTSPHHLELSGRNFPPFHETSFEDNVTIHITDFARESQRVHNFGLMVSGSGFLKPMSGLRRNEAGIPFN